MARLNDLIETKTQTRSVTLEIVIDKKPKERLHLSARRMIMMILNRYFSERGCSRRVNRRLMIRVQSSRFFFFFQPSAPANFAEKHNFLVYCAQPSLKNNRNREDGGRERNRKRGWVPVYERKKGPLLMTELQYPKIVSVFLYSISHIKSFLLSYT